MYKKMSENSIPFAKGYCEPTDEERLTAIGHTEAASDNKYFKPNHDHFHPVPRPQSQDDWLAQYNVESQTFDEYVNETPWLSERRVIGYLEKFNGDGRNIREKYPAGKIYLAQIGTFKSSVCPAFADLVQFATIYLGLPVVSLGLFEVKEENHDLYLHIPDRVLDLRANPLAKRKSRRGTKVKLSLRRHEDKMQIEAPHLLKELRKLIPPDGLCLIGLTMFDLFETSPDLFVAGLAWGRFRSAVFSFARYDPALEFSPEFWYDISKGQGDVSVAKRKELLLARCCKLIVHEIGHLLGFDHCVFFECCMNGSGHLEEDFRQPLFLCPVCLHKLYALTGLDLRQRYEQMRKFCLEKNLGDKEALWLDKRLLL